MLVGGHQLDLFIKRDKRRRRWATFRWTSLSVCLLAVFLLLAQELSNETVRASNIEYAEGSKYAKEGSWNKARAYWAACLRKNPTHGAAMAQLLSSLLYRSYAVPVGDGLQFGSDISQVAVSQNGKYVAVAFDDGSLSLFDGDSGIRLEQDLTLIEDGNRVTAQATARKGRGAVGFGTESGGQLTLKRLLARLWNRRAVDFTESCDEILTFPVRRVEFVEERVLVVEGGYLPRSVFLSLPSCSVLYSFPIPWQTKKSTIAEEYLSSGYMDRFRRACCSVGNGAKPPQVSPSTHPNDEMPSAVLRIGFRTSLDLLFGQKTAQPLVLCSCGKVGILADTTMSFLEYSDSIVAIDASCDGSRFLTLSEYGDIVVWDSESQKPLATITANADRATYSPDGTRILSTTDSWRDTLRLWDSETGDLLSAVPIDGPEPCFSGDGLRLVVADGNMARFFDTRDMSELAEPIELDHPCTAFDMGENGSTIAVAVGNELKIFHLRVNRPIRERAPISGSVSGWTSSSNGLTRLTTQGTKVKAFSLANGSEWSTDLPVTPIANTIEMSSDDSQFAVFGLDSAIYVTNTRDLHGALKRLHRQGLSSDFRFLGNDMMLTVSEGAACIWDIDSQSVVHNLGDMGTRVTSISADDGMSDRITFALGSAEKVAVYSMRDRRLARMMERSDTADGTNDLSLSADGKHLLVKRTAGIYATEHRYWDVYSTLVGASVIHFESTDIMSKCILSPSGSMVVFHDSKSTVVRSIPSGKELYKGASNVWRFSDDDRFAHVQEGGFPGGIVVETSNWQPMLALHHPASHLAFKKDTVLTLNASGEAHVGKWPLVRLGRSPAWLPTFAENIACIRLDRNGRIEPVLSPVGMGSMNEWPSRGRRGDASANILDWLVREPSQRTVSPFSRMSLESWTKELLSLWTDWSLKEAEIVGSSLPAVREQTMAYRSWRCRLDGVEAREWERNRQSESPHTQPAKQRISRSKKSIGGWYDPRSDRPASSMQKAMVKNTPIVYRCTSPADLAQSENHLMCLVERYPDNPGWLYSACEFYLDELSACPRGRDCTCMGNSERGLIVDKASNSLSRLKDLVTRLNSQDSSYAQIRNSRVATIEELLREEFFPSADPAASQ
jgi:WD40 repeat protein